MKNQQMFLQECKELKIPKYIQNILINDLVISKSEITDSYLLHHSKHATTETLRWRYEKLTRWIKKHGGIILEDKYDYDKEYCGTTEKLYPFRFRFSSFNKYKSIFSYIEY
ncbi:MAG: hypothetical protein PHT02_01100 [Tissierellia bacterium]|nr:hypothetical protein [Tissierellia bacterium]